MTKPTVGRVVHYYAPNWAERACNPGSAGPGYNGQGAGPYAAVVTQVFANADGSVNYANLKVLVPFAAPVDIGSVPEEGSTFHHEPGNYWVWPPREEAPHGEEAVARGLSEEQIAHMADRFLCWRLPENFNPDCGIHFDADEPLKRDPRNLRYEPNGTNLFDATQARAMVAHMAEGLPK